MALIIWYGPTLSRVTKIGKLMMCKRRHICSTPITTKQYLWEHIKGSQWLEDIFSEARSVEQDEVFHPHAMYIQMYCIITGGGVWSTTIQQSPKN